MQIPLKISSLNLTKVFYTFNKRQNQVGYSEFTLLFLIKK